eukprot:s3948_g3.t5
MMAEDGRYRYTGDGDGFDLASNALSDGGSSAAQSALPQRSPTVISLLSGRTGTELEYFLRVFWVPAAAFVAAEMLAFLVRRASFFVVLTDNAFEVGPTYSKVVEVHVWASIAMWSLAAVQVLGEQLRRRRDLAWIHRLAGQAMLLLFFLVVLPTSLYLSALQHLGDRGPKHPRRIDVLAPAVAAVLLDTAFCTAFFLYRGWRVARLRASTGPRPPSSRGISPALKLWALFSSFASAPLMPLILSSEVEIYCGAWQADAVRHNDEHGHLAAAFLAAVPDDAVKGPPSGRPARRRKILI